MVPFCPAAGLSGLARVAEVACLPARVADRCRVDRPGWAVRMTLVGRLGIVFGPVVVLFLVAMEHSLAQLGSWAPSFSGSASSFARWSSAAASVSSG
jgi:hypothetical protein